MLAAMFCKDPAIPRTATSSRIAFISLLSALLIVLLSACGGDIDNPGHGSTDDAAIVGATDAYTADAKDAETVIDDAGVPDSDVPDSDVPDSDVPDSDVPDSAVPDSGVPDSDVPDSAVPDSDVPDSDVPDSAVPDSAVPDSGVPDSAVPDSGVPDSGVPDSAVPDSAVPDSGVPDSGTSPAPIHAGIVASEGVAAWDALPSQARAEVAAMYVFLGHQSVGLNIIDGIRSLGGISIHDWASSAASFGSPGVGHNYIGANGYPYSKINAFEDSLDPSRIGDAVDVAAMKLCWIDFTDDLTNVGNIEGAYQTALLRLQAAHPAMRFVHITTPLERMESVAANQRRLAYGDWLKSTYGETSMVFDLAWVESTQPDGTLCTRDGVRELCEMYASDNGHLNALGRERAAKAFLYTLYNAQ